MSKETDEKIIKSLLEYEKKILEIEQAETRVEMFLSVLFLVFCLCLAKGS